MAEGKRGFLQGILKAVPIVGGKKPDEGFPKEGALPVYHPKAYSIPQPGLMLPHRIKYRGIFDLDDMYKTMALWFKDKRFELHEGLFKSKPPEMEYRWRGERRRTSYILEVVTVHVHMWGDYDVEVIQNGKKKKMANVRMIITINGGIYTQGSKEYADIFGRPRWNENNLQRKLVTLMNSWVMKREIGGLYEDRLYYEMYDLYAVIKENLKMGAR